MNTDYLLETKELLKFIQNENRKSIPIEYFEIYDKNNCQRIYDALKNGL